MRRAGGRQRIPRPDAWHLVDESPWDVAPADRLSIDCVVAAVSERGPGARSPIELDGARWSAVLVALFEGSEGAEVLLTRRAPHLSSHRGEVSFPGGRMDPGETPIDTALREAHEEVLLDPSAVEIVGELDHIATLVSRSLIVPVVGRLAAPPVVSPGTSEVDRIFTVSLAELTRADTYREERWGPAPHDHAIHFFELDDETVWGATARMLVQLLTIALA